MIYNPFIMIDSWLWLRLELYDVCDDDVCDDYDDEWALLWL